MDLIARMLDPETKFNLLQYRYGLWIWSQQCLDKVLMAKQESSAYDWTRLFALLIVPVVFLIINFAFTRLDIAFGIVLLANGALVLYSLMLGYAIKAQVRGCIWRTYGDQYGTVEEFLTSPFSLHRKFGRKFA